MDKELKELISFASKKIGIKNPKIFIEHPNELSHGDYACNIAMIYATEFKTNPMDLASSIVSHIPKNEYITKVEVAKPGFINFTLSKSFFIKNLKEILEKKEKYGQNDNFADQKIMIEYTDTNPFKQLHIGHLMSNAIGESLSRIIEFGNANIIRACYSGDSGLHVAKAIWGYIQLNSLIKKGVRDVIIYDKKVKLYIPKTDKQKLEFWGISYTFGSFKYEENKEEIDSLNKKILFSPDKNLSKIYKEGREISIKNFQDIFKLLDTKFEKFFYESEMWEDSIKIVNEYLEKSVFQKSENAIIFKGEDYDKKLHTRVFINSLSIPTYEAKELALNTKKFQLYSNLNKSIIITANEQSEYFKVVLKALEYINQNIAEKTHHISHGMLKFASGKMSSRKGNIISGMSLIKDTQNLILEKMKDRNISKKEKIAMQIAIGAIRYSILRQEIGKDIIFDFEKSISFEGDSGPYLQYTAVRAKSVLDKANKIDIKNLDTTYITDLERKLYRFPEVIKICQKEHSPHFLSNYLLDLASSFNSYYAHNKILDGDDIDFKLALTASVYIVLKNGLQLLGIEIPDKM